MLRYLPFLTLLLLACGGAKPTGRFSAATAPPAPDYATESAWAALPTRADMADRVPTDSLTDRQADAVADVFYVYPTLYFTDKTDTGWNAPTTGAFTERVQDRAMLNHASIFNAAGRVYAPYYRQAHIQAYYVDGAQQADAKAAFALAYADVRRAFQYYLDHYNGGRPIIIASHSQGTTHCKQLVREFFDGQVLQQQLVAAYLVGIEVAADYFTALPVCESSDQTGCYVSWRTWRKGHRPTTTKANISVVNPINWTTDTTWVPRDRHAGAVLYKYDKGIYPKLVGAGIQADVLWADKPRFFGSIFFTRKNYHIADYNLFWLDVRLNAVARVAAFGG